MLKDLLYVNSVAQLPALHSYNCCIEDLLGLC